MSKKYEIEPLDEFVVLRYFKGGLSKGGIAMPDISGEYRFYVVAVGDKVKRPLKEGDEVMVGAKRDSVSFNPPSYMGLNDHMVLHESHILAKLRAKVSE